MSEGKQLKKTSELKHNIMLQYTLLSFFMTLLVAVALVAVMLGRVQNQLIISRGDFYKEYIASIPENYSEILPYFGENQGGHPLEQEGHSVEHGTDSINDDNWAHFSSDLSQYPYIQNIKIWDGTGRLIWNFPENHIVTDPSEADIKNIKGAISYTVVSDKPELIINYYIPITAGEQPIGIAEIVINDVNLKQNIKKSREQFIMMIFLSGFVFYISLFILFYRVYLKQKHAIAHLDKSQVLTIRTMSLLAELKDNDTGEHIQRTSDYCRILARSLKDDPEYSAYITDEYIADLERSAPLHDIGKVGIPESILLKPGRLTEDEFNIIKKHPKLGADVLRKATESLDFRTFFKIGYQIVLHHHENWDGTGYPDGLKGREIPLSARIMAIADVYDALTTERPYKQAFSHDEAVDLIRRDEGRKFDPTLVANFIRVEKNFKEISLRRADPRD